jgi:hypothetical protein
MLHIRAHLLTHGLTPTRCALICQLWLCLILKHTDSCRCQGLQAVWAGSCAVFCAAVHVACCGVRLGRGAASSHCGISTPALLHFHPLGPLQTLPHGVADSVHARVPCLVVHSRVGRNDPLTHMSMPLSSRLYLLHRE